MNKFGLIVVFCLLFTSKVNSQCNYSNKAFQAGEYVSYELYYNWGFLWFNAGVATFYVNNHTYNNQATLLLKSIGTTNSNYDWLYKVRDTFNVVINPTSLLPYSFNRNTFEGGYKVDNNYTFNYTEQSIVSQTKNSKKELTVDTLKNNSCTFDILTAIYVCRNIDFTSYKKNDTIPLSMIIDGEINNIHLRFLGQETIINKDFRKFKCNKFSILLVEGTVFVGGEDMFIWVTNDNNQIPILIEAKIVVGSVKAVVNKIEGIKWPANYQIYEQNK